MKRPLVRLGIASLLLSAMPAFASLSFHDPFGATGADVIGDPRSFDIQFANITITQSVMSVEIGFNFGLAGHSTLDSFGYSWSPLLSVGDVLFLENGVPKWGAPIADHAGSLNGGPASNLLFAGQMYAVLNPSGWFSARQALNDPPNNFYRYDSPVWLRDASGSVAASGFPGFVNVAYLGGDGTLSPRFDVTLTVPTPAALHSAWQANLLSFSFASATCGNDIIAGFLDPRLNGDLGGTPEPSAWLMAAGGLLAIAGRKYARQRRARLG